MVQHQFILIQLQQHTIYDSPRGLCSSFCPLYCSSNRTWPRYCYSWLLLTLSESDVILHLFNAKTYSKTITTWTIKLNTELCLLWLKLIKFKQTKDEITDGFRRKSQWDQMIDTWKKSALLSSWLCCSRGGEKWFSADEYRYKRFAKYWSVCNEVTDEETID